MYIEFVVGPVISLLIALKFGDMKDKKNLGLPMGDGAHSIRHSFITRMRQLDVHEYWIDRLTGHARKSETARYGCFDLPSLNEQLQKLR